MPTGAHWCRQANCTTSATLISTCTYVTRNVYHKQKLFYKSRFWLTYNLEGMSKSFIPVYIRLYTRDKLFNQVHVHVYMYKTAACTRCCLLNPFISHSCCYLPGFVGGWIDKTKIKQSNRTPIKTDRSSLVCTYDPVSPRPAVSVSWIRTNSNLPGFINLSVAFTIL